MTPTNNGEPDKFDPSIAGDPNASETQSQATPATAESPTVRQPHPIEAVLTYVDDAVRKAQPAGGGGEGSGLFALLAIVAAQIGVKIAPPQPPAK